MREFRSLAAVAAFILLGACTSLGSPSGSGAPGASASVTKTPLLTGLDPDTDLNPFPSTYRPLLSPGHDADVVVWTGDPLETSTWPAAVFIAGRQQPDTSRGLQLRDRYLSQATKPPSPWPGVGGVETA